MITTLTLIHHKNWPNSSEGDFKTESGPVVLDEKILISLIYFCNLVIISLSKKAWPFNMKKRNISTPKEALCQVWLELVVLEQKILKFRQCIFTIS